MTPRAAVYLRVSKRDQTLANQVPDLERMIAAREFAIAATYQDEESGVKRRPALERLLADARRRNFDVVCVWALDRLGRTMSETVARVLELEHLGIRVLSARETFLDQPDHVRPLLVSVFAWVADWERRRLIERTNAGLARARAQGKQLGRPNININPHAVELAFAERLTVTQTARRIGVSRTHLYRWLERRREMGAPIVPKTVGRKPDRKPAKPDGARSSP